MKIISSASNHFFKYLKKTFRKNGCDSEQGISLVEGEKLCGDLWNNHKGLIQKVIISESYYKKNYANSFVSSIDDLNKLFILKDNLFSQISTLKNSTGVIFFISWKTLKNQLNYQASKILICYKVQDPLNLGVILRTAEVFEWKDVILVETARPYTAKVLRSSQGAPFYLNISQIKEEEFSGLIDLLRKKGFLLLGATLKGEQELSTLSVPSKRALLVGSEGLGIPVEIENKMDICVKIDQKGSLDSLNVSVASGILCYYLR